MKDLNSPTTTFTMRNELVESEKVMDEMARKMAILEAKVRLYEMILGAMKVNLDITNLADDLAWVYRHRI